MNKQAVWALAQKDMRAVTANIQVWLPMLIVPIMLGVVLPGVIVGVMSLAGPGALDDVKEIMQLLEKLPPSSLRTALEGLPKPEQQAVYMIANYLLASFFLIIPLMVSSVIAADSFTGEKERGTMESLLFAPVDLLSLFTGKVLAAFLPSVGLSLITFVLCGITVNGVGWPLFGRLFFPQWNWLPLMLLVIPAISLAAVLFNVFISARVATFQAAYQMGGLVVLPVLLLVFGQISGVLLLEAPVVLVMGVVLILLDLLLLRQVAKGLDRTRLFESQIR